MTGADWARWVPVLEKMLSERTAYRKLAPGKRTPRTRDTPWRTFSFHCSSRAYGHLRSPEEVGED
jgi:hypothetical protein